jgi:microcin C transport system ATP-binding protein
LRGAPASVAEAPARDAARHRLSVHQHDLRVVRALAHRIVVLRHGKVVEQGPADVVFARPQHPYTRALMEAAFHLEPDETGAVAS